MTVGKRPAKVKLLSEQIFLESGEGFRNVKRMSQNSFRNVRKILGKVTKFLKRLNYYPNEISDDP